jgi:hypothetical protein
VRNERGSKLVDLCEARDLRVANSFYKRRAGRKWTWRSSDGRTRNEIDYIIAERKCPWIKNVSVVANFSFNSDHRLVRAKLNLSASRSRASCAPRTREVGIRTVNPRVFRSIVTELLAIRPESDYETIKDVLKTAERAAESHQKKDPRVSELTKEMMRFRHELRRQKTIDAAAELTILNKEVRRRLKEDLELHRFRAVDRAVREGRSLKRATQETAIGRKRITQLKDEEGLLRTDKDGISSAVQKFYEELYASRVQVPFELREEPEGCPPFIEAELRNALRDMKTGKAPGEDGITTEMLKFAQEDLLPRLTRMFNRFLETGSIDDHLADSSTLLLHKKGDPALLKNYRPISLLPSIGKLLTKTILNRIQKTIDQEQDEAQAGFRQDYSTVDHILTICELIERCQEYRKPLYICFVDFEKAFDSVEMNALWTALQQQGIHPRIIRLLRSIYLQGRSEFRVNADQKVEVKIARGVRQGDPVSPVLFNAALEGVIRKLDWANRGIKIDGRYLSNLRFADDIALTAETPEELQDLLQELSDQAASFGLKINEDKTAWLGSGGLVTGSNEGGERFQVKLNEKTIERTASYVYLGRLLTMPMDLKAELRRRVQAGWAAFAGLKSYLTARRVPMKHKRRLFNSNVLPAMLYGCETWAAKKEDLKMLEVAQRRIERRMANVTLRDRWTNEKLRGVTKVKDISELYHHRKIAFAAKIAAMDPIRWTRTLIDWCPREASRARGRPRTRWADELAQQMGSRNWTRRLREGRDAQPEADVQGR